MRYERNTPSNSKPHFWSTRCDRWLLSNVVAWIRFSSRLSNLDVVSILQDWVAMPRPQYMVAMSYTISATRLRLEIA